MLPAGGTAAWFGEPGAASARTQEDALALPHRYDEDAAIAVIQPAKRRWTFGRVH